MDGEIRGKPNLHLPENLFRRRNASGKRLAFLFIVIGGDGGESNSPSRGSRPRICYRLSRLFVLTQPSSVDEVRLSQSIVSLATLIDLRIAAPQLFVIHPRPSGEVRGMCPA